MAPLVRSTDSFFSSGATIKAEPIVQRPSPPINDPNARLLMPSDTLGRELEAALAMDDDAPLGNMATRSGDDGIPAYDGGWDHVKDFGLNSLNQSGGFTHPLGREESLDIHQYLHAFSPEPESAPQADFSLISTNLQPSQNIQPQLQFHKQTSPFPNPNPPPNMLRPEERGISPRSLHSSYAGSAASSEYSYETTEIDTDDDSVGGYQMAGLDLGEGSGLGDGQGIDLSVLGLGGGETSGVGAASGMDYDTRSGMGTGDVGVEVSRTIYSDGRNGEGRMKPGGVGRKAGSVRGKGALTEEELIREKKERRKQINRESAQRGRTKRKQETEHFLTQISSLTRRLETAENGMRMSQEMCRSLHGKVQELERELEGLRGENHILRLAGGRAG